MKGNPYSVSEIKNILHLYYNKGMSAKNVSKITGRTTSAIENVVLRHKDMIPDKDYQLSVIMSDKNQKIVNELTDKSKNEQTEPVTTEKVEHTTLTPREMIKALYDLGYRIKNNDLVVLVEKAVNIKDIING